MSNQEKKNAVFVSICDGAHLCLHVGGPYSQRYTPHKESLGDMDKDSLSFIQLSISYHIYIQIQIERD